MPATKTSRPEVGVLLVELSRPQSRNAVTGQMIQELVAALEAASKDNTVRAVVIAGDPAGRAFCAGADLSPETSTFAGGGGSNGNGTTKRGPPPLNMYRDAGGYSSLVRRSAPNIYIYIYINLLEDLDWVRVNPIKGPTGVTTGSPYQWLESQHTTSAIHADNTSVL